MTTRAPTTDRVKAIIGVLLLSVSALINPCTSQAGPSEILFPRPPEIEQAVDFWTRVYSEVDSNSGYIHDSQSLGVVYEVYPLPTYASPKRQHRIIQKRIRHYEQLLKKIAAAPEQKLNPEERRLRQLWGSNVSPAQLRSAAQRVRFQRGQSDRMIKGLKRAARYEKRIREILHDAGLPEELAALPHVESSYNPAVRSKAGAAGLWQIMPATGRRYLRVNNVIDERLDPYKATSAAAQLLKHNYSVLKSWPLAITAYNHGLSGVRRAIRSTGSKDIETIIQQYDGRAFKFASRNFYSAFLAAYDVSNRQQAFSKGKDTPDTAIIVLNAYMPAEVIVEGLGISEQRLKELNPDLGESIWRGEKHIPKSYPLHIPLNPDLAHLQTQLTSLEKRWGYAKQVPDLFYRVQRGDNLAEIAQRHDTSIQTLMTMNSLRSRHRINAGQVLRIPKVNELPSVSPTTVAPASIVQITPEAVAVASQALELMPPALAAKVTRSDVATDSSSDAPIESGEEAVEENETVVIAQSDLAADPADYLVAEDGTIEVQVGETLGHYAHWLDISTQQLRALNAVRYGQPVIVGRHLRLLFPSVDAATFESKRKNFHAGIQNRFFRGHRIVDVKDHVLVDGDNLWELSTQTYQVPLWLLRQYNPDLALDKLLPLSSSLRIPVVQRNDHSAMSRSLPAFATKGSRSFSIPAIVSAAP